jgi:hypothetical protein
MFNEQAMSVVMLNEVFGNDRKQLASDYLLATSYGDMTTATTLSCIFCGLELTPIKAGWQNPLKGIPETSKEQAEVSCPLQHFVSRRLVQEIGVVAS